MNDWLVFARGSGIRGIRGCRAGRGLARSQHNAAARAEEV